MMDYLLGTKYEEVPETFDEIHYSEECSGHCVTRASIGVENLRLKKVIPALA